MLLLSCRSRSSRVEVAAGQFSGLVNRVEREIQQWIKAAVESTLGQVGIIGAVSVEEVWNRLKEALRESGLAVVSSHVELASLGGASQAGRVPESVASMSERGMSESSVVPTEFGDRGASVSGVGASASATRPGKNLIRSCGGFS